MKILFLGEPLIFKCVPRIYPIAQDDLKLFLRNENTNEILEPEITFIVAQKLSIQLTQQPDEFAERSKYEITLKVEDEILYKGKLMVLKAGTDIQNYAYSSQTTTDRFDYSN